MTTRERLDDLGHGDKFLGKIAKALFMKQIINNLNFINIKNFYSREDFIKGMRKQAQGLKKIFIKDTSHKEVLCSIYKIHLKYTKNSQTLTIRK
jgi:hypothetical protein